MQAVFFHRSNSCSDTVVFRQVRCREEISKYYYSSCTVSRVRHICLAGIQLTLPFQNTDRLDLFRVLLSNKTRRGTIFNLYRMVLDKTWMSREFRVFLIRSTNSLRFAFTALLDYLGVQSFMKCYGGKKSNMYLDTRGAPFFRPSTLSTTPNILTLS